MRSSSGSASRRNPLLALLLAIAMLAAACGGGGGSQGGQQEEGGPVRQGGTVTIGADQEPPGFNSNTSKDNNTWTASVLDPVLPSVFRFAPDFSIRLDTTFVDSAELTSQSPQTVVYKIRKDATWSDGVPITADDFIYLWQNNNGSNKGNDVAATTGYEDIGGITGSDAGKTVTVVFKRNFSGWKQLFSNGGGGAFLPAHYMRTLPGGWNTGLAKQPPQISGGPFIITNYTPGQSLTLKRNDRYWGPRPNLDSIVFRFLPESTTQPQALQNREVDLIYPQPQLDLVQQVKNLPDVKTELNPALQHEQITFNTKNEFLAQLPVRQAVAKAIDRDELVRRTVAQFAPQTKRIDNRIWMGGQKYYQAHGQEYASRDLPGAQRLLEQAGFTRGPDGIYQKGGKRLSLRMRTTRGNQLREQQLAFLQAQLRQAGIATTIDNVPSNLLFAQLPKGDFDLAVFAWVGNPLPVSGTKGTYVTGGGSNFGKFSDPKVDQLYEQAVTELDEQKAADLGNQIDEELWAQMATLPLYQKPTFIAYRNTLVNVHDNPTQEGPLWNAGSWGLRA